MISLEREKLLSELEQKIGYSFRSRALLDRALTHRSFANERAAQNCRHNEAMEFLGDAVLGFVVSAWLLERFPDLSEGKLSKMKAYLVSEASLVELAEAIELGLYILLNRGEEKTGGRRKRALLADAYEALIGVVYIDGGISTAERFLRRELLDKVKGINPSAMIGTDFKSTLQEYLQAAGGPAPEYAVVDVLGPDHRRTFCLELRVGGRGITRSEGNSIKLAQQEAARRALDAPDVLAEAIAAYQERRANRSNRHHSAESAPRQAEPDRADAATAPAADDLIAVDPAVAADFFDDDNPFLAIVEELEAAQNGQHENGNQPPSVEAATGAAAQSVANIESRAEDDTDAPRTAATDA
ncbi:MAG: ribonuclease III [Blastocatellia bacterium]